jgi:hypothetical protein
MVQKYSSLFNHVVLWLVLVLAGSSPLLSWGNRAHRLINFQSMKHLPASMQGFKEKDFYLTDYASEADRRSQNNDIEYPKHFIDIENYPEYFEKKLTRSYPEFLTQYGESSVKSNGTLPYSVAATYDSLVRLMKKKDWNTVFLLTADFGHYIADLHQPFHVTANYDGQLTKNNGIHWRYETELIDRFYGGIYIRPAEAKKIEKPLDYIFDQVGKTYNRVTGILKADNAAQRAAKGKYNAAYYMQFWKDVSEVTTAQLQDASTMFANLLYTGWLEAGSPKIPSLLDEYDGIPATSEPKYLEQNFPNPFNPLTKISYTLPGSYFVQLNVFNLFGQEIQKIYEGIQGPGRFEFEFNGKELPGGVYFIRLQYGEKIETRKMILTK